MTDNLIIEYNLAECIFLLDANEKKLSGWDKFLVSSLNSLDVSSNREEVQRYPLTGLYNETDEEVIYSYCVDKLIKNQVLHFHSSFIIYKSQAVLFTGPSGIGKTTQAELWEKYRKALIVNGDVSLIRKREGKYRAYGCPLHGSSPYCENMDAPLLAIIVLEQAAKNKFSRLKPYDAVCACVPEIYRPPNMDFEMEEILWKSINDLLSEIPVYKLCCRPDEDAVQLVEQALFKQEIIWS